MPSRLLLQERRNLAPSSFDYHWMLAFSLSLCGRQLSSSAAFPFSNLLLCYMTHAHESPHVSPPRTRSVHASDCSECTKKKTRVAPLENVSHATPFSLRLISRRVSKHRHFCFHIKGGTFTPSTCLVPLSPAHSLGVISLDCTRAIC